jgi:Raf kinase inhibitor-like YbhB/YbcL family protein
MSAVCGLAKAAEPFSITSSAFKDGTVMAQKYAGALKTNPNCIGQNVSPALSWANAPGTTKSFAIMLVDPEGRNGLGVAHWVAYGIAPTVTGFAEGEVSGDSAKYVGGKSTQGLPNYTGPCPGPGTGFHHYTFVVLATDLDPGALPAGLTRDELNAKLDGHAKAATAIVGLFKHP